MMQNTTNNMEKIPCAAITYKALYVGCIKTPVNKIITKDTIAIESITLFFAGILII
jgi:hypothetical protein